MCTGIETLLAVASAASAGSTLLNSSSNAPPIPSSAAAPAPTSRAPGAVVRVGGDDNKKTDTLTTDYEGFKEKRVTGKALGGLGRGGLGL